MGVVVNSKALPIGVGSKAPPKLEAARELLAEEYADLFPAAEVIGVAVVSGVSEMPMSLEETVTGAHNRAIAARAALPGCVYGIGIEDGFIPYPGGAASK